MIRIRVGASWRHDPGVRAALRRRAGTARGALRIVDVLAFEVDGVDIGAGRTEGDLLPSLERLLRAVAALLAGEPQASVHFGEGAVELVLRRSGSSALLTLVALDRPARVLARDVEVDLAALAGAALEACADLVRELAAAGPGAAGSSEARRLREAARRLRATEPAAPARPRRTARATARRPARQGALACTFELDDPDVLAEYGGGGPDLGSLLAGGRIRLLDPAGVEILSVPGPPFLLLRDLAAAADRLVLAVRRAEPTFELMLPLPGHGGSLRLGVDLVRGRVAAGRRADFHCPPLDLARALLEGARAFATEVRARNPRQAGNAYLADLDATAAERLAHVAELAGGDLVGAAPAARAAPPRAPSRRPLGPGRLRRISFRRTAELDVGAPSGPGLARSSGLVVATGERGTAALEPATGRIVWRGEGCDWAAALPGAVLVARGGVLEALSPRTGASRWRRPLPGGAPRAAVALGRGPLVLVEPGAVAALEPASGRLRWRFAPPAAGRVAAAAFGDVLLVATDAGFLYGLDAAGTTAFRLRLPGPVLHPPAHAPGSAVVLADGEAGASLLAIDPAAGTRLWEAPLDLTPSGPPAIAAHHAVVAGTIGGDPIVTCIGARGRPVWTAAPPLAGAVAVTATGSATFLQDAAGAVIALGAVGATRWSFARPPGHPPPGPLPPAMARGTVLSGADGLVALDGATGERLGAAPDVAPVRLLVGSDLSAVALEADGTVIALRLATHLSVV
jgi:outer membrane protein assembly factor BamB